jgi:hypothetical protein
MSCGCWLKEFYCIHYLSDIKHEASAYIQWFVLFFYIGIKKILEYCKEQGECLEKESTDLMKKYELC